MGIWLHLWDMSLGQVELPRWLSGKESAYQYRRHGFNPWVGKISWRRKWQPILLFLPGESHEQSSLPCCSPWGSQKSQTQLVTKQLGHVELRVSCMMCSPISAPTTQQRFLYIKERLETKTAAYRDYIGWTHMITRVELIRPLSLRTRASGDQWFQTESAGVSWFSIQLTLLFANDCFSEPLPCMGPPMLGTWATAHIPWLFIIGARWTNFNSSDQVHKFKQKYNHLYYYWEQSILKIWSVFKSSLPIFILELKTLRSTEFGETKPRSHICLALLELSDSRPGLPRLWTPLSCGPGYWLTDQLHK